MSVLMRVLMMACVALTAIACSSESTHFYTLLRPQADAELVGGRPAMTIDVQPVQVPVQLDQRPMVVRLGNSEVALVESRRWIAPLADEIHEALSDELNRRLSHAGAAQAAVADGTSSALPSYRVLVDVQRFDGWLGHRLDFAADWTVIETTPGAANARRWACSSVVTQNVAAGYPALVAGAQQAIGALAGDIANLMAAAQSAGARLSCPARAAAPQ